MGIRISTGVAAVLLCVSKAAVADGAGVASGRRETAAGAADAARLCRAGAAYPAESAWGGGVAGPASATSGTPRIEQWRQGKRIAVYARFADGPGCTQVDDGTNYLHPAAAASSGCGPFTRTHSWRLWAPGDRFLVYPAVYTGEHNQPWIGPQFDGTAGYNARAERLPDNITIQGVVEHGRRPVILLQGGASDNTLGQAPVYFDRSTGVTMDGIDVVAGAGAAAGKAAVYEAAGSNLTLGHMRVSGFGQAGTNGVFGAGDYTGTLTLNAVELGYDGGTNGPAHNAYIGASRTDPNFTVIMRDSWSHDAFYGHLFKSRAQVNVFTGNLFQGGVPWGSNTQAEAYLLDVPNGGRLTVRGNVFVKNASGEQSNGISLTYLMEGRSDARTQSVDVEDNVFVTFAATYDGSHPNVPFGFLYPAVRPDGRGWPGDIPVRVSGNSFVGYCAGDGGAQAYRGDGAMVAGFGDLGPGFGVRK